MEEWLDERMIVCKGNHEMVLGLIMIKIIKS